MNASRIIKAVAVVCLGLTIVALVVTRATPATGYETSIYAATPLIFWVALAFSIVCGIAIIVHQLCIGNGQRNLWTVGLTLGLLGYTALLSLYIIRGYALWNAMGDSGTHLGLIQDIVASGSLDTATIGPIDSGNYYPVTHLYAAEISSICDIAPTVLVKIIPLVFALLYVGFMYLLAKAVLPNKGAVILVTVASLAPLHSSYLGGSPNQLADLLFPLVLLLLIKSFTTNSWRWRALFMIMVVLLPVFHPVPSVALVILLVTVPLARLLYDKIGRSPHRVFGSRVKFSLIGLALLFVWGGVWTSSYPVGRRVLSSMPAEGYTVAIPAPPSVDEPSVDEPSADEPSADEPSADEPSAEAPVHQWYKDSKAPLYLRLIGDIRYAQAYGYNIAQLFFNIYGAILLYIVLALVAFHILWRRMRAESKLGELASLYGPLAALAFVIVGLYLTAVGFPPLRLLTYIVLICTIFVGFIAYYVMGRARVSSHFGIRVFMPILVTVILIGAFGNGALKLYPSPRILSDSYQTTRTQIAGMDWLFDKKDYSLPMSSYCQAPTRFADFLLTQDERGEREDIPRSSVMKPPPHFGYDKQQLLGEWYSKDTYLLVGERDRLRYVETFPVVAKYRFYPEDFERLNVDPTLDRLYSSGGFDVWLIHAQAEPSESSP